MSVRETTSASPTRRVSRFALAPCAFRFGGSTSARLRVWSVGLGSGYCVLGIVWRFLFWVLKFVFGAVCVWGVGFWSGQLRGLHFGQWGGKSLLAVCVSCHTLSLTLSHSHTHSHTHIFSLSLFHTHTHTLTHTRTHTNSHSLTHSLTYTHTHSLTRSPTPTPTED